MKNMLLAFGMLPFSLLCSSPALAGVSSLLLPPVRLETGEDVGIRALPLPRLDGRAAPRTASFRSAPGRSEAVGSDPISTLTLLVKPLQYSLVTPK